MWINVHNILKETEDAEPATQNIIAQIGSDETQQQHYKWCGVAWISAPPCKRVDALIERLISIDAAAGHHILLGALGAPSAAANLGRLLWLPQLTHEAVQIEQKSDRSLIKQKGFSVSEVVIEDRERLLHMVKQTGTQTPEILSGLVHFGTLR